MQRYFAATPAKVASGSFFGAAAISSTLFSSQRTAVTAFNGSHDEFQKTVAAGHTIVDCYTDWCAPCKQVAPHFADLSEKYPDVKFVKVNVEENEDVGALLNVRSIPYFVLFENGKSVGSVEGANMQKLTQLVEGAGKSSKQ